MNVRVIPLLLLLSACARVQAPMLGDSPLKFELTSAPMDVDAPVPSADDVVATPLLEDFSPAESAAFQAEALRLSSQSDPRCRVLADAIHAHLDDVRMYENAIVRYLGPYKFYGVGHSYQHEGQWLIRIARRLDDLNPRTPADETRTMRHEMSHTLGATEQRAGEEWSARDYAYNCA